MGQHENRHTSGTRYDRSDHGTVEQWHAIDMEDIAVTPGVLEAIKGAARQILPQYVPSAALRQMTIADSLALFTQRVFWGETSGKLFICSELGDKQICLDIPSGHWQFRVTGMMH